MKNELRMRVRGCALIVLLTILGCSPALQKEPYRGYYGVEPAESELATLDLGTAAQAIIDDMYFVSGKNYRTVKLIAGMHTIKWVALFGMSVLVEPSGYAAFQVISKINFEPGHTYRFFQDRTTGHGYKVYTWIEDMTTGKIVYGERKP
jgi:hypothetical protein